VSGWNISENWNFQQIRKMRGFVIFVLLNLAPFLLADNANQRLRASLFRDYDKLVRPPHPVKLTFAQHILALDLNPTTQVLTIDGWLHMAWYDYRLKWNRTEFEVTGDNIEEASLKVPHSELWLPDIAIYNGIGEMRLNQPSQLDRALIYQDGEILWIPPVNYKVLCKVESVSSWINGAEQECTVKIGSWTESKSLIEIVPIAEDFDVTGDDTKPVDLTYYLSNRIDIFNTSLTISDKKYPCCTEVYTHLEMKLHLKHMNRP